MKSPAQVATSQAFGAKPVMAAHVERRTARTFCFRPGANNLGLGGNQPLESTDLPSDRQDNLQSQVQNIAKEALSGALELDRLQSEIEAAPDRLLYSTTISAAVPKTSVRLSVDFHPGDPGKGVIFIEVTHVTPSPWLLGNEVVR